MPLKIIQGQAIAWVIEYPENFMEEHGYTYADIEDISFNIKKNTGSDADDKYLQKTYVDGVDLDEPTHGIAVRLQQEDTLNVELGTYQGVVAVKVAGLSRRITLSIEDSAIEVVVGINRS